MIQESLDVATEPWGVKVERVEVKDVRVPEQLQRAMAAEAEAAREARAKVIAAEGEHKASRALRQAAEVIIESPAALQLRYLQTLNGISAENNSTIIFPVPIDIMNSFMQSNVAHNQQFTNIPNQEQYQIFKQFEKFQEAHKTVYPEKNKQNARRKERFHYQVSEDGQTTFEIFYQESLRSVDKKIHEEQAADFDDIEIPRDDAIDVDLDVEDIDFKIPDTELEISNSN